MNSQLGVSPVPESEIRRLQCEDVEVSTPQQPVPPQPSSHTANNPRQVIRISKLAYLGCAFLLFAVTFPIFGWPLAFGWLLAAPILAVFWVARVRTTVTSEGLELRRLVTSRTLTWPQIEGLRFPERGWARARLVDGTEVPLPVVTFDRLPEIAAASGGRIPDPYAAAAERTTDEEPDTDDK